jgi:hypothetical protein
MDMSSTQTKFDAHPEARPAVRLGDNQRKRRGNSRYAGETDQRFRAAKRIDAGLYLKSVCKLFQTAAPDCEAMEWTVEDSGVGMVSENICRVLALAIGELVRAAAACLPFEGTQRHFKIVLRRRAGTVMCAIESRAVSESGACAPSGIHHTQHLIAALGASGMLRLMPERNLIAIMVDESNAEPRIANALAAYRLARVAYRPFDPGVADWICPA